MNVNVGMDNCVLLSSSRFLFWLRFHAQTILSLIATINSLTPKSLLGLLICLAECDKSLVLALSQ